MNREVTLPRGAEELERAGTLDNLRIAAGRASGERRGMVFSDSDVYKWLEALAWELGREPSAELERLARETTELVAAAQEPDGYLNTWCQVVDPAWRWTDLEHGPRALLRRPPVPGRRRVRASDRETRLSSRSPVASPT